MLNNKFSIFAEFDCGNCPLQKDEEMFIRERFINLFQSLNLKGMELLKLEIEKYGN